MNIDVIIASTLGLLLVTLVLVSILLYAKSKLAPYGPVKISINNEKDVEVSSGNTLLTTLGNNKIFLPSACGGGGTCVQCKCQVLEGGGEILSIEVPHFTRKEISEGWRLGCQVKVKDNMKISVPEEVFGIKKWEAKVLTNYNVASFIKELVIEMPEEMNRAGHLFAYKKGSKGKKLLLIGHLDTVFEENSPFQTFERRWFSSCW